MSLILKDTLLKECANSYKTAMGVDAVLAGELPQLIYDALTMNGAPEGMEIGSFKPANVNGDFTVNHGLGVVPKFIFAWIDSDTQGYICQAFAKANISQGSTNAVIYVDTSNIVSVYESTASTEDNENAFCVPKMPTNVHIIPAFDFKYIAIA